MKICSKCSFPKERKEFGRRARSLDGMQAWCKSCMNGNNRRHYTANRDEISQKTSEKYHANPERKRAWRKNNPEKVKASSRIWNHRRRARRLSVGGSFTKQEWKDLCLRFGEMCVACYSQVPLAADHIVPLSRGGRNTIDNIQPLCKSCNSKKHIKTQNYAFWFMVA